MTVPPRRLALLATAALLLGCPVTPRPDIRLTSTTLVFHVTADPRPPLARERVRYQVVVRDRETGQPVEEGEGRIFASSRDGASAWDILLPGEELGTYYANLNFIVAGEWAIAVQFRRSEDDPLERVDWMQDVLRPRDES